MENVTRRSFLAGACGVAVLGATALPVAAEATVSRQRDGRLTVRVKDIPALSTVGGAAAIGTLRGNPIGVARTGASTYVAFSLRCPHQGVTVMRSDQGWLCPAHGSQFKGDGGLILGPALRRLARVPSTFRRGRLIVG